MSIQDVLFGDGVLVIPNRGDIIQSATPEATIRHNDGRSVPVEALFATVLPGLHAAAFAISPPAVEG